MNLKQTNAFNFVEMGKSSLSNVMMEIIMTMMGVVGTAGWKRGFIV